MCGSKAALRFQMDRNQQRSNSLSKPGRCREGNGGPVLRPRHHQLPERFGACNSVCGGEFLNYIILHFHINIHYGWSPQLPGGSVSQISPQKLEGSSSPGNPPPPGTKKELVRLATTTTIVDSTKQLSTITAHPSAVVNSLRLRVLSPWHTFI